MTWNQFESPDGRLTLMLPESWAEYDNDEENTFAFFDTREWTGNLRITPLYLHKVDGKDDQDIAARFVEDDLNENGNAERVIVAEFDGVHYKVEIEQDGKDLIVYYWTFGQKDKLFLCSFTIDKSQQGTVSNNSALSTVTQILNSIKTS